ncbi:unnamed protein product [Rotaria magnacalcarata]|uniref:Uncharacterized protein n=1 Tax=Rotaria magnacalcarata TaxID=392030 RepID=A0A819WRK4_9BILA|nr:unnamed protein product [Rotaria magnacalcarata]CAF4129452.1 unnamed protein product [Rotaria magnacalcarata]
MSSVKVIFSIAIILISLSNIYCVTDAEIYALQQTINHLSEAAKGKIYQSLSDNNNEGRLDSTHWCCNINPGVDATARTRQITYSVQRHARRKCGYSSCGVFGWSSCTRWCDEYWSELQYGVETYTTYEQRICPVANLVCCAGYITVVNHCFTYEEVLNNKDVLEILVAMGIPINPTMG